MNDPLFFNKVAGASLSALLIFFGLPQIAAALRGGHHGGHEAEGHPFPQYPVAFVTESATAEEGPAIDFATLLAAADTAGGARKAALCKSCHTFDKGGANGTGPNLYGVVGRAIASVPGFNYSSALKTAGGIWDFERLGAYIENSQAFMPGTAMIQKFPNPEHRAQIIAYLNTLSDAPLPLPTPAAAASPTEGAGAEASAPETVAPTEGQ
ncbi:MAG: c-type cytochrome [Parvularculaceae bacterium]|nr:c-type cytochrome [Parvularculaceae bacterium]